MRVGMMLLGVSLLLLIYGMKMIFCEKVIYLSYDFGGGVAEVGVEFLFDWVSVMFYSIVLLISGMILIYSEDYMKGDKSVDRFMYMMVGFITSMGLVVFSSNLILLLFGWDGLGLVSYCLVIYYQNSSSFNAGMITILMNRIGDVGLLVCVGLMMGMFSLNYVWYVSIEIIWEFSLLLVGLMMLAGMTKSAQIPFSAWLPAAMAAPTPVSSLVHSSTLVAAGVFLLIRVGECLGSLGSVLFMSGVLTMMMAGVGANFESDLKKVIALSTLSQLGIMMMIVSLGQWYMAYFHMMIHALFKAMMFMCVGGMIHGSAGNQDVRMFGGMMFSSPMVGVGLSVSSMALMGYPFLAGFYSKDLILEYMSFDKSNMFIFLLLVFSFIMTVSYSLKIGFYPMWGAVKGGNFMNYMEMKYMNVSMLMLFILSIIGGAMFSWIIFPFGNMMMMTGLEKMMGVLIVMMGAWVGFGSLIIGSKIMKWGVWLGSFLGGMWFMGSLSGNPILKVMIGGDVYLVGDMVWNEYFVLGVPSLIMSKSCKIIEGLQMIELSNFLMCLLLIVSFFIVIL
uniref:NADH-ubiquinone oxidoreductase chain 5 n=1 Tax=Phrynus sp. 1 SEM-2008 TaxID=507471 RepID=B2CKE0_9ARAC|nr:NADH dehydrogenase subunit 5 [Phrynus sp. 1 SEM-2008]